MATDTPISNGWKGDTAPALADGAFGITGYLRWIWSVLNRRANYWYKASVTGGDLKSGTATTTIQVALGGGYRAYVSKMQLTTKGIVDGTEFVLKDDSNVVLFMTSLPANLPVTTIDFDPPICTSPGGALLATATTSTGAIYVNVQGFNSLS